MEVAPVWLGSSVDDFMKLHHKQVGRLQAAGHHLWRSQLQADRCALKSRGIRTGNKAGSRPLELQSQSWVAMPDSLVSHMTSGVARVQAQQQGWLQASECHARSDAVLSVLQYADGRVRPPHFLQQAETGCSIMSTSRLLCSLNALP